jgi:PAS domain S-box-containing protein
MDAQRAEKHPPEEGPQKRGRACRMPKEDQQKESSVHIHSSARELSATASWPDAEERFRLLVDAIEDYAIFMLDRDGRVVTWNRGAQKIKGYTPDEIIGQPFTVFYTREAIESGWPQEELRRAEAVGRFEDEGWRLRKDGSRFWANVVITALRDDEGQIYGFAKVTRDLSERRRHEEASRLGEERIRLLVDAAQDYAILMLDPQGRIESWSSGATAITGYSAEEALGRFFSLLHTPQDVAAGKPQRELALALSQRRVEDEGWRVRKDGSLFWANVIVTPVFDGGGTLRGFAQLARDMSERRRLVELENSSRRMSEFLAILSHELRNPLAPLRNAVSIMQIEPLQSPRLRNCRDIIDRQLSQLTRLVDDLLDAGRIVTGKISLNRERISFRDVALRSVEAAQPLIEARRHRFLLDIPDDAVEMLGDDARLVQVLQNLLANAAKYTDNGGEIRLRVAVEGAAVVSTVSDNGRGIAPEALERIFELFTQEDASHTAAEGGLGIGLTLCRSLAEMLGGSLIAESAGPGRGSRFTLRLPIVLPDRDAPGEPAGTALVAHVTGLRTLVVDDNRDSAETMAAVLRLLGSDARAVYDGEQAIAAVPHFKPDAVLLDLNMPGADGYAVQQRLRDLLAPHAPYMAAVTGYGHQGDRAKTLAAGFDAHLTKPVGVDELRGVLAQAEQRGRSLESGAPPARSSTG